jgi:ParB-like chromosome segregation protein Spo0J
LEASLKIHELASIFPPLAPDELAALAADIKANGLRQPIIMHGPAILDGRNRWEACQIAGVAPRFEKYQGDDPVAYVISANIHRRHLNAGQRAGVAEAALPFLEEQAAARMLAGGNPTKIVGDPPTNWREGPGEPGEAVEHAAKLAGVGENSVRRMKTLSTYCPAGHARVMSGESSLNAEWESYQETNRKAKGISDTYDRQRELRKTLTLPVQSFDEWVEATHAHFASLEDAAERLREITAAIKILRGLSIEIQRENTKGATA